MISWDDLEHDFETIHLRMIDELELAFVFSMENNKVRYYEPSEPLFGAEVASLRRALATSCRPSSA